MNGGPTEVKENIRDYLVFPEDALKQAERKTIERNARITELIHYWTHRLNLPDWDIRHNPHGSPDADHTAEITFSDSDKAAVIVVDDAVPDASLEPAIVHEMLHAVARDYTLQAERLLIHVNDDRSRVHLQEMLEEAGEQMIETLTRSLSRGPRVIVAKATDTVSKIWAPFAR